MNTYYWSNFEQNTLFHLISDTKHLTFIIVHHMNKTGNIQIIGNKLLIIIIIDKKKIKYDLTWYLVFPCKVPIYIHVLRRLMNRFPSYWLAIYSFSTLEIRPWLDKFF